MSASWVVGATVVCACAVAALADVSAGGASGAGADGHAIQDALGGAIGAPIGPGGGMVWDWQSITGAVLMAVAAVVGLALTAATLPGTWLMVLTVVGVKVWRPEMVEWWTIVALLAIALLGEGLELVAGALGAKKGGGTRSGAIGAAVGSLVGAIGGTVLIPIPIVGSIVGAVGGAAGGAFVGERYVAKRTAAEARSASVGAGVGRLLATVVKTGLAGVMAVVVLVAAVVG